MQGLIYSKTGVDNILASKKIVKVVLRIFFSIILLVKIHQSLHSSIKRQSYIYELMYMYVSQIRTKTYRIITVYVSFCLCLFK